MDDFLYTNISPIFQVRNLSSASLTDVIEGLQTQATERNTHTSTPRTNRTTARCGAATSRTPTPPASGSTWRSTGRRRCGAAPGIARTATARSPPAAPAPDTASSSPEPALDFPREPVLDIRRPGPGTRGLTSAMATRGQEEATPGSNLRTTIIITPSEALLARGTKHLLQYSEDTDDIIITCGDLTSVNYAKERRHMMSSPELSGDQTRAQLSQSDLALNVIWLQNLCKENLFSFLVCNILHKVLN